MSATTEPATGGEPTGTLEVALAHAEELLQRDPVLAIEQANEILRAIPNYPPATLLLGKAQRASGDAGAALRTLTALVDAQHRWAAAHYELALSLAETGDPGEAIAKLRRAVELKPDLPDAWRALGDLLTESGDTVAADAAFANHIKYSTSDPKLMAAATALVENRIPEAEHALRAHLKQHPTDVAALRMLAEVAARLGRYSDAETLLERCLELAPSFPGARHNYAIILHRLNKSVAALEQVERLLEAEPRNTGYHNLKAVVLAKIGDYAESIELFAGVLKANPKQPKIWMSYAHALSTVGREEESIAAYRRSIALLPSCGEAYWSLANLKTFKFSPEEVGQMRAQLDQGTLSNEDRFHFEFALGKALEDQREYAQSFEHYAHGNRLRLKEIRYLSEEVTGLVRRTRAHLSAEFFAARAGFGCQAPDPIFIVGLPRSGSTLIEQILASHSAVEGTMELPNIIGIATKLGARGVKGDAPRYPMELANQSADDCRRLGEQYLADTRIQRKLGRPFFIDKMPNNFMHIGLIHLILPSAKIVDARRHPMACGFSLFKQHFARGQNFSYSLEDIGHFYRDYVEMMAHYDAVLPGRVHRVFHEALIEDTETEVRRLLDYCGLPFEESCLRFYENDRAVRTASAQQVR
ncbi:MAG: sulfotransferase, partial [Proteobacteria bacterium]|nr:sulfotransferase [Pseudomonadota bacterium]